MAAIFQTTFSKAFSWMRKYEFRLKFHRSLFLMARLTNIYPSIGSDNGLAPLSEPMMVSLPTHICVTRTQWVNRVIFVLFWSASSWIEFQVGSLLATCEVSTSIEVHEILPVVLIEVVWIAKTWSEPLICRGRVTHICVSKLGHHWYGTEVSLETTSGRRASTCRWWHKLD